MVRRLAAAAAAAKWRPVADATARGAMESAREGLWRTGKCRRDRFARRSDSRQHAAMKRQRGVALLIALLVVALATILIAGLLERGGLTAARTRNQLREMQAENYAKGLEDYATRVLRQDEQNPESSDAADDIWGVPL